MSAVVISLSLLAGCRADADPVTLAVSGATVFTEGKDYAVVGEVPVRVDDQLSQYFGRINDELIVSTSGTHASGDPQRDDPRGAALVAVNRSTGATTALARHGSPGKPRYIVEATTSRDRIVWLETTQPTYDSMPWELYSYDLATGRERHIASHRDFGIRNPPWPSERALSPQIIGDQVYFAAVDRIDRARRIRDRSVYSVPIDGGRKPRRVVPGGSEVFVNGTELDAQIDGSLVRWNPARFTQGRKAGSTLRASCGSFSHEGVRVTCSGASKRLHVSSPRYGRFVIDVRGKSTGYLNATNRWVTFSTSEQAYVVDLERRRLMKLAGSSNAGTRAFSGSELAYTKQNGSGRPIPLVRLLPPG